MTKELFGVKIPGVNLERRARRELERKLGVSINSKQWRRLKKHLEIEHNGKVLGSGQSDLVTGGDLGGVQRGDNAS